MNIVSGILLLQSLSIFALLPTNSISTFLEFCNKTSTQGVVDVAIAFSDGKSRGWYSLKHGSCQKLILGRYEGEVYYYAVDGSNKVWQGEKDAISFCVKLKQQFDFPRKSNCQGENVKKVKMKPIRVQPGFLAEVDFN